MNHSQRKRAPDQTERDRIASELDKTLLVEAAAGTGKTTSMIDRMVALLATGKCEVGEIAAVTFTRKAAAELRTRFQVEIEKAVRETEDRDSAQCQNLRNALPRLERAFIGTIHSFCARLLRERPVEAGVDLDFRELDDTEDRQLRKEAWESYLVSLYSRNDASPNELDGLLELGLEPRDLESAFLRFCDYPDVPEWPAPNIPLPNLKPLVEGLQELVRYMDRLSSKIPSDTGNDRLLPLYRRIPRMLRQAELSRPADLMEIVELITVRDPRTLVQKNWPGGKDEALRELERWNHFGRTFTEKLLPLWRAHRYGPVIGFLKAGRSHYDKLRLRSGRLNYQDLLMQSARLLRKWSNVRLHFRNRYKRILVDEFQDTDPIQAEVMLLLTAENHAESDWRKCKPTPGSLFVVGDPKQSIYRFRRADITTYNEVRRIIMESGGETISLRANFRSSPAIIDWVNSFSTRVFPAEATDHSPADAALLAANAASSGEEISGVFKLTIPAQIKRNSDVYEEEAKRAARYIRRALNRKPKNRAGSAEASPSDKGPVSAGDFLVVTGYKAPLETYARTFREMGIPNEVTGSATLNQLPELRLLLTCLFAVVSPDDPVALLATLRSELFGISDRALYAFKQAGGEFSFREPFPESFDDPERENMAGAFVRLSRYSLWFKRFPPATAVERLAADLGIPALACAAGSERAGSLSKALELLRSAEGNLVSAADAVEYLAELVEGGEAYDGLPVRPYEEPVTRVMNLHKAKGLEAPYVFLGGSGGRSDHEPDLRIDRSGAQVRGYMAVHGKGTSWGGRGPLLAHPKNWQDHSALEKEYRDAEQERLLYVAATRSGSGLVVSQRESGGPRNPWQPFEPYLGSAKELRDPTRVKTPAARGKMISADEVLVMRSEVTDRWERVAQPTHEIAAAKSISVAAPPASAVAGEHGTEWGTVIHQLLELAMLGNVVGLEGAAQESFLEQGLDLTRVDSALELVKQVTRSELWLRARRSRNRLTEVPFQFLRDDPTSIGSVPTVLRGVIDLVFHEPKGWVIVDYKTDDRPESDFEELTQKYQPQIQTYAEAWQEITNEKVFEKGLFFVTTGRYVKL